MKSSVRGEPMRYRVVTIITLMLVAVGALAQTENILANFNSDGGYPFGEVILDSSGNVYGMSQYGGSAGCGKVFELTKKHGTWRLQTIHSFTCGHDGGYPISGLAMDSSGNLYGTTPFRGAYNRGVVFKLTKSGRTWSETTLYSFRGKKDGGHPRSGVTISPTGVLYGNTYGGCSGGCGTVFTLTKTKTGAWQEKVIHTFIDNGTDGWRPSGLVTIDKSGDVWGTTYYGGAFQYGVVYKLTKARFGWKESILHSFSGGKDGCEPYSGMIFDSSGNAYGTTAQCGRYGDGTVYQLKKSGHTYDNNVILAFNGSNGQYPTDGKLAMDASGNIYGTTVHGGAYGYGAAFELATGTWTYADLHDFNGNGIDGSSPNAGPALDSAGNLYGTTASGGKYDGGTVYRLVLH